MALNTASYIVPSSYKAFYLIAKNDAGLLTPNLPDGVAPAYAQTVLDPNGYRILECLEGDNSISMSREAPADQAFAWCAGASDSFVNTGISGSLEVSTDFTIKAEVGATSVFNYVEKAFMLNEKVFIRYVGYATSATVPANVPADAPTAAQAVTYEFAGYIDNFTVNNTPESTGSVVTAEVTFRAIAQRPVAAGYTGGTFNSKYTAWV